jgi:hypothetical protein
MPSPTAILEVLMRSSRHRWILAPLLVALLAFSLAGSEETKPKAKMQKKPSTQPATQQSTQTAPAKKQPPAPGEAGIQDVQGTVMQVDPARHALIIRTTTNDHQVFVTPQTELLRDGKKSEIKAIQPGDRIESCRFNAKKVILQIKVITTPKPGPAPGAETPQ